MNDMLRFLADLLEIDSDDREYVIAMIRKRVYKGTTCGACVLVREDSVTLSGYCEGSDAELPGHTLTWPFEAQQWWDTLDECDREAQVEWDDTHGCSTCSAHFGVGEFDICPVWKDCPECEGHGIVI